MAKDTGTIAKGKDKSGNSIASYDSATVAGSEPRALKRRLADFSRLGAPEWYAEDPPTPPAMAGTAQPSELPAYTTAHSAVMHGDKPWLGLVLYSHAPTTSPTPMYHNSAKIAGEVRMVLDKPKNLCSIDIWFVFKLDSVLNINDPPTLTMTATLWNHKQGYPSAGAAGTPFKDKFPSGTFVFPFEFPALPTDTLVEQHKNKARVPLPPTYSMAHVGGFSGKIEYTVGVNVKHEGFTATDDEFDVDVQYLPLARAVPRVETPFPYLPTRKDWPHAREVVGEWTLTPFGGRGKLGEEPVELEGVLGIQEPAVYTAGQTLAFSLLLWSSSALALQALAQPGAIDAGFFKSDIFGLDALSPKKSSRDNRMLERLARGRVWLAEAGRPAEGTPPPECAPVELPPPRERHSTSSAQHPSHMQALWAQNVKDDDATLTGDGGGSKMGADTKHIVRLDGEVRVPACSHPSFRHATMAREYVLQILIRHPQYSHISPAATVGIVAEVPVWYVLDRFEHHGAEGKERDFATLPVKGLAIQIDEGAVRLPMSTGHVTTQQRPTSRPQRMRINAF